MQDKLTVNKAKETGNKGEQAAADYLIGKGYEILDRNYRQRQGELDIIARHGKSGRIVFVEVKTRRRIVHGVPAEAVNHHKIKKIIRTASRYLRQRRLDDCPCRFDVIEVYALDTGWQLKHIEDAFEA